MCERGNERLKEEFSKDYELNLMKSKRKTGEKVGYHTM